VAGVYPKRDTLPIRGKGPTCQFLQGGIARLIRDNLGSLSVIVGTRIETIGRTFRKLEAL
jgi:hypothetical protein